MVDRHYDSVSVNEDSFDCALTLTVWNAEHTGADHVVRIAVEDVADFMRQVVNHGTRAMADAARRLEVGDCRTCNNTGLVDVEKHGRLSNEYCPDCRDRWPAVPFANAPQIVAQGDAT